MDKRFKFIRSKERFKGLEDYKYSPYMRVKKKSIDYPVQYSLFNEESLGDGFGLRVKEGYFFELLSHGIYGGSIKNLYHENGKTSQDIMTTEPDVTDTKKGIFREVKGVGPGGDLKLIDEQIAKYCLLQTKEYFKNPPRIRFEIFRHDIRKIQENYKKKNLESLIGGLSQSIKFSISLPFSLVFQIYCDNNKFTCRHDNELTYNTLTRLNSSGLNNFLAYPRETIESFGLDPDDFIIKKKRFPRTVFINDFNITPFPMLFIYNIKEENFIEGLPEKIKSDEHISTFLYNFTKGLIGEGNEEFLTEEENLFTPLLPDDEVPF